MQLTPKVYKSTFKEKEALRKEHGVEPNSVVLLFTGGSEYIKGGKMLLDTLAQVNYLKPVCIFFAGHTGSSGLKKYVKMFMSYFSSSPRYVPEKLSRMLCKLSCNEMLVVNTVGYCSNIQDYFKMADICLVPYSVPHQAMPIFEAGMAKIPVLVSDFSCYQYEVDDGFNGFLLAHDRPDVWARKLESLMGDLNMCKQMGRNNYQVAMRRHDINIKSLEVLRMIEEVLSE